MTYLDFRGGFLSSSGAYYWVVVKELKLRYPIIKRLHYVLYTRIMVTYIKFLNGNAVK